MIQRLVSTRTHKNVSSLPFRPSLGRDREQPIDPRRQVVFVARRLFQQTYKQMHLAFASNKRRQNLWHPFGVSCSHAKATKADGLMNVAAPHDALTSIIVFFPLSASLSTASARFPAPRRHRVELVNAPSVAQHRRPDKEYHRNGSAGRLRAICSPANNLVASSPNDSASS